MSLVLDASAILALVFGEPGGERVSEALPDAAIAAPNLSEILSIMIDRGRTQAEIQNVLAVMRPLVRSFDLRQAEQAGALRRNTRTRGLSLGDRACLALALTLKAPVLTADRAWAGLDLGVPVEVIR